MGTKNFDKEYDWSRSLSDRIKGMKDTALGIVWKKGREQKIKEIELLRTYCWLISAGFPQYVQLHRDNVGLISNDDVARENHLLEENLMEALIKRINTLNQHAKTKFPESTDIQSLTGNSEDFNFSFSSTWLLDRSMHRWLKSNDGSPKPHLRCLEENEPKSVNEKSCTCQGEGINQAGHESRHRLSSPSSPFTTGSPSRKPKKKKGEGKKKSKPNKADEDTVSSDNAFSTPVNSSLTSSDFKASQNNNEADPMEDREPEKGMSSLFCGAGRGDHETKSESRKSSLQTELNRSSQLRQQYRSVKNFFKSVGDRISSAKSSKMPRYCTACNGNNEPQRLTNSLSCNPPRALKSTTCSDSFLVLDSRGLPDIRVFGAKENAHKRCKSDNCLVCNSRRRSGYNVRRSGLECRHHDAPRSVSLSRRSMTPTSNQYNNSDRKTLLSLEMPRRRFSNSSSSSPKPSMYSASSPMAESKLSPFRKMVTVPDKMERLSGETSSQDVNIPLYFNNSIAPCRTFLVGDGKSNADDSSYYDCFEGSSNYLSDNNSGALNIDEKNDRFCNGSQSEESRKSSYQSLEANKSFRQKELDSILKELYSKINTLDKIRFNVERDSGNHNDLQCPHSTSPKANKHDDDDDELIFRTFSMEKAKFFNLDQNCLPKTSRACDKCKCHKKTTLRGSNQKEDSIEPNETNIPENSGSGRNDECGIELNRRRKLKKDLSLLTASELFILRKLSLIHLTSITDKYLLSNVDNLLAPKPDLRLSERRDSSWMNSDKQQKIFGSSLRDVVKNFGQPLAGPIERALAFLSFVGGDAVGIFRRPGVKSRICDIKSQLDEDPDVVDFHSQSVYDVADMVKLYFRELPGSLFTKEYSQLLINIFSYVPKEMHLSAMRDIMCLLPDENRAVLRHLLNFLQKLAESSTTNQMDINNLATCFAPSLFYSTNHEDFPGDSFGGGQGCWDRNGAATNGKRGQTIPLHHSHPNSSMHRSVHQTSSNSADYVREATEMKDHMATKECLSCLIVNAHLVFQVSDEMSNATSNFVSESEKEWNYLEMLKNKEDCLSTFIKRSICSTIHNVDNNLSGWFPVSSSNLDIEVYFKSCHVANQVDEGHFLGTFAASTFLPVRPREALRRIANEREQWDDTLLSWKVLEEIRGLNVDESDLRSEIQGEISRMAKNSDIPTIVEEDVGGFSGKFDWSKVLGFKSYSGDVVHYTTGFAPNSDLEFCEMRLWQSSDSTSILLSTSINHPSIHPSDDVRCHVMDSRYVIVSVNDDTSKVYFFSRVDMKGHLPLWYEKVYGHLVSNHMKKLLAGFEESL